MSLVNRHAASRPPAAAVITDRSACAARAVSGQTTSAQPNWRPRAGGDPDGDRAQLPVRPSSRHGRPAATSRRLRATRAPRWPPRARSRCRARLLAATHRRRDEQSALPRRLPHDAAHGSTTPSGCGPAVETRPGERAPRDRAPAPHDHCREPSIARALRSRASRRSATKRGWHRAPRRGAVAHLETRPRSSTLTGSQRAQRASCAALASNFSTPRRDARHARPVERPPFVRGRDQHRDSVGLAPA